MPADAWLYQFVKESWKIEGLDIEAAESRNGDWSTFTDMHANFLAQPTITTNDLILAALAFTYGKGLIRNRYGMDVQVGQHVAPRGGPSTAAHLKIYIVQRATATDAFSLHKEFEDLHPFMDGNGRTGRMLWAWMMEHHGQDRAWRDRGFLWTWYYQSLQAGR